MKRTCPYCGSNRIDWHEVHNGLGMEQVSPAVCYDCGAREVSAYDEPLVSQEEMDTGWHRGFDSV